MPAYAVFFSDDAAVGMTRVIATDAAAAELLVLLDHPDGTVKAVSSEMVATENRQRMLTAWLQSLGGQCYG